MLWLCAEENLVADIILDVPANLEVTANFNSVLDISCKDSYSWNKGSIVTDIPIVLSPPLAIDNYLIVQLVVPALRVFAVKQLVDHLLRVLASSSRANDSKVKLKVVRPT